jgi:hypothetical protein
MALPQRRVVVTDQDLGFKALMKSLRDLSGQSVAVTVDDEHAAVHEFGSPALGIPERSFMRSTFDENAATYRRVLMAGIRSVLDGQAIGASVLSLFGARYARDIQLKIRQGHFVPNAPSTVARKGSSRPLIDTGRMRNSIRWELRPRRALAAVTP